MTVSLNISFIHVRFYCQIVFIIDLGPLQILAKCNIIQYNIK